MKREIETTEFGPVAPCAPYGIWEDPSGRTGTEVLFHRPHLPTDTTAAMSPTIRPRYARAFFKKA